MTPSFEPAHPGHTDGLFRAADHVVALPEGSALAILDLKRGLVYATTPFGAESWSTLVGRARGRGRVVEEASGEPGAKEGRDAWARIAGFLSDRGLIEPIAPQNRRSVRTAVVAYRKPPT